MGDNGKTRQTNKIHFDAFQKRCRKWIALFGLTDWHVDYFHKEGDGDCFAWATMNTVGRIAAVTLARDWPDEKLIGAPELDKTAFHEVVHVLLEPLVNLAREQGDVRENEIQGTVEAIIRRLEHVVLREAT